MVKIVGCIFSMKVSPPTFVVPVKNITPRSRIHQAVLCHGINLQARKRSEKVLTARGGSYSVCWRDYGEQETLSIYLPQSPQRPRTNRDADPT